MSTSNAVVPSVLDQLERLGILKTPHNSKAVGSSNYGDYFQSHWSITQEYKLNALESSILKRLLRSKGKRSVDLRKMQHELEELIRQEETKCLIPTS